MRQEPDKDPRPPEATRGVERPEPPDASGQPKADGKGFRRLVTTKTLGVTVVALLALQGAGVAYHMIARSPAETIPEGEISLGAYSFEAAALERGPIVSASFDLYVAPLAEADRETRQRFTQRKYRVQQDIEELLRQAHGGDFIDPTLGELKRRIQERINKTLATRAVADVIITGLEIHRSEGDRKPIAETAGPAPWAEGPSS